MSPKLHKIYRHSLVLIDFPMKKEQKTAQIVCNDGVFYA